MHHLHAKVMSIKLRITSVQCCWSSIWRLVSHDNHTLQIIHGPMTWRMWRRIHFAFTSSEDIPFRFWHFADTERIFQIIEDTHDRQFRLFGFARVSFDSFRLEGWHHELQLLDSRFGSWFSKWDDSRNTADEKCLPDSHLFKNTAEVRSEKLTRKLLEEYTEYSIQNTEYGIIYSTQYGIQRTIYSMFG